MFPSFRHWRSFAARTSIVLAAAAKLFALEAPLITKVEPPDWAAPVKAETLRLMVTGKNLTGGKLVSSSPRFRTGATRVSERGTFAWVDLQLPAGASAGQVQLRLTTPGGNSPVPFQLTPRLSEKDHFAGVSDADVIYLVMPDRFANGNTGNDDPEVSKGIFSRSNTRFYHGGDFAGIRRRLPYLKSLGITALWLTPIYDNANRIGPHDEYNGEKLSSYHGYGAVDFYGVEEHFGTLDEYCALVEDAHRLGIKVIQDQVANHTGSLHPWLDDPPAPDWFHGTQREHINETWQLPSLLDPLAGASLRRSVLDGWFGNSLPDLNQDNPEVARYLIQNTLWWIGRTGIDALREDTVPYVPRAFWQAWSAAIHERYPRVRIVGEAWDGDDLQFTGFFQGGRKDRDGIDTGIDTVFDFPLYFAIQKTFAAHGSAEELERVFSHDFNYTDPSNLVTFIGLHDTSRFRSEAKEGPADLERAFTFLFTARGAPMIYYGDEIGMEGGSDPDNRRDFPGGWAEDTRNAFEPGGRTDAENRLIGLIQKLTKMRSQSLALQRGKLRSLFGSPATYAFERFYGAEKAVTVIHAADSEESVALDARDLGAPEGATWKNALSDQSLIVKSGRLTVPMRGRSVNIYLLDAPESSRTVLPVRQ